MGLIRIPEGECPYCGHSLVSCDFPGCFNVAEYDGWYGQGFVRRRKACEEHAPQLRGWDEFQEKNKETDNE